MTNVLVRDEAYDSLIDWDDAGWGDAAMEFVSLPTRVIDSAFAVECGQVESVFTTRSRAEYRQCLRELHDLIQVEGAFDTASSRAVVQGTRPAH